MLKFVILVSLFFTIPTTPQSILLENPSFEGQPQDATTPTGWDACGKYSTPDLLPGYWGVKATPAHGKSFVGLIVREDNTWEYLGQTLQQSLEPKKCYEFSLSLAKAIGYSGYSKAARSRIWGSNPKCRKGELLGETGAVDHAVWKKYDFILSPKKAVKYLVIEAYYTTETPYKGNILIDNCSSLKLCARA